LEASVTLAKERTPTQNARSLTIATR
jgi:hypothetical protein